MKRYNKEIEEKMANKTIIINDIEYALQEEVWECMLAVSKEKDDLKVKLMMVELNHMFGIKENQ